MAFKVWTPEFLGFVNAESEENGGWLTKDRYSRDCLQRVCPMQADPWQFSPRH